MVAPQAGHGRHARSNGGTDGEARLVGCDVVRGSGGGALGIFGGGCPGTIVTENSVCVPTERSECHQREHHARPPLSRASPRSAAAAP
eukprot:10765686-Lingulodinium_polyedra.AAC.1